MQYVKTNNVNTLQLKELLEVNNSLSGIANKAYVEIAELFLNRPDVVVVGQGKVDILASLHQRLYEYYIDPDSIDRPADWYERAKAHADAYITLSPNLTDDQKENLLNIPKTSEEYQQMYPYGFS